MVMQFPNIYSDVFETDPLGQQALFQSMLPQNVNPLQQQQFGDLFQPTFQSFLGRLGQQVRQGQAPNLRFTDFLQTDFNPQKALLRMPTARSLTYGGPTIFRFGQT